MLLGLLLLLNVVLGDLYIQTFRGSNNRLDEQGRDRANGNRLFDSQNNDRGGYNVGKLSVYVGETVPISWSNQHGSGTYQVRGTEVIMQYACDKLMRDGTTTNRIPDEPSQCYNFDCDTDVEYGRHESFTWYQYCKATYRNRGLFTANQNLQGKAARFTRQNPDGTRRGYECPEERDYYPYWRATMWRDIIIYTNQVDRCNAYQTESENVKSRWQCVFDDIYWSEVLHGYYTSGNPMLPLNQTACQLSPTFNTSTNETRSKYYWKEIEAWGIDAPSCTASSTTRTNHHGLIGGRTYWTYSWTVPDPRLETRTGMDGAVSSWDDASCCVIRLRYNITTADYPAWESDSSINAGVNSSYNANKTNPDADNDPAEYPIWLNFGLTRADVNYSFNGDADSTAQQLSRGYVFRNNPRVDPFGKLFDYTDTGAAKQTRIQLQLAINTNQFGRTFQDRTHCFQILERPNDISDNANIKLLSVQGKRGNIVQVYPATEYFFMPEPLQVSVGDYVHFCWTGSNTNPDNNDGQGKEGTDRSNLCPLTQPQYDKSSYSNVDNNVAYANEGSVGDLGTSYPDYVEEPSYGLPEYYNYANKRDVTPSDMAGFDINVIKALCTTRRIDQLSSSNSLGLLDYGNMEELDDAGTTFCITPQLVESEGRWNFLCTRNNNFSNRDQKSTLLVASAASLSISASSLGGVYSSGSGQAIVKINSGMIESGNSLEFDVTTWANTGSSSTIVEITGTDNGAFSSDLLVDGGWIELWIPYTPQYLNSPAVYYKSSASDSSWSFFKDGSIQYQDSTYYAVTNINNGGFYKVNNQINGWAITSIFISLLIFSAALSYIFYLKCKKN